MEKSSKKSEPLSSSSKLGSKSGEGASPRFRVRRIRDRWVKSSVPKPEYRPIFRRFKLDPHHYAEAPSDSRLSKARFSLLRRSVVEFPTLH
uniref:Uncharacterized protein n=1 Tax=Fagus sylvatica TaxID=28930 RepID=A0A2N9FA02_FAGSY